MGLLGMTNFVFKTKNYINIALRLKKCIKCILILHAQFYMSENKN